jgi:4-alpha-glucanotransferase
MRSTTCEPPPPRRRAGLLLHPTSLPGPHGAGDLGPAARRFAGGNWRWRFREEALSPALATRLAELARLYGRSEGSVSSNQ